jgi:methyl-accepting chemotaxis protein
MIKITIQWKRGRNMKLIQNLKVSKKLWLLITPSILALILLLLLFIYRTTDISNYTKTSYYDEVFVSTALILNADRDFYQASIAEKELVLSGSTLPDQRKEELMTEYNENITQTLDRIKQAIDNISGNEELYSQFAHSESKHTLKQLSDSFNGDFKAWQESFDATSLTGDIDAHLAAFDTAREDINEMTELLEQYGEYSSVSIEKSVTSNIITLSIIITLVILIILLFAAVIVQYLKKSILNITKDMNTLANNDLTFEPYQLKTKDEIGTLSSSVNTLITSLREIVHLLDNTSTKLTDSSTSMRLNSDEITTSMNEIANTVGEIAESAGHQASDAEQVAREFDNLGLVIQQNSDSAKKLSGASHEIQKISKDGLTAVTDLSHITENNQKSFDLIFDTIRNTNESASKIGEVSNIIASIAQQTNLLALNAAIEAARAGEAGKGFAVVAEEIRKLAEQSSDSTSSIHSILEVLQDNITSANTQSSQVREAVDLQVRSVNETKERYVSIVSTLETVNQEIDMLDSVSQEMNQSRLKVVDIISSLSAIAQENAASTEETSATTEEVLASMITINDVVGDVDRLSKELKDVIKKFKINVE